MPVSSSSGNYYAVNNALETTEEAFTLKGAVIVDSRNTAAYFGMLWNFKDESNHYLMRYFINGITQVLRHSAAEGTRVIKNVAGAFTPVNAHGYEIDISSAVAGSFNLSITGSLVYTTTSWMDTAPFLSGGYGGLYANNGGATYDDFSLDAVPEPMAGGGGLMGMVALGLVFIRRRMLI